MAVKARPDGYHAVSPYLVVDGAAKLIDFLAEVFDAEELERLAAPGGRIGHAEVRIGDSVVMIGDARGEHAPTQAMLDEYKKVSHDWDGYAEKFSALIAERQVENTVDRAIFQDACLLCSEPEADHCHRRLVAEYLSARWGDG